MIRLKLSTLLFLIVLLTRCGHSNRQETLISSYTLANELKGSITFAQGGITTTNGISFSHWGDTLYTSRQIDKKFDNGRSYAAIFASRYENGKWTDAKQVQLGLDIDAYHPVLSADNSQLFFNSRSNLDSVNKSIPHDIWVAHRTSGGWSIPETVEGVNSLGYDSYPSVAKNNNLYFNSDRAGGKGGMDFYVAYFKEGKYQEPINIEILNSSNTENDLVVDPDERFIIFNRYIDSNKEIDLYISFRNGREWNTPRKLDQLNSDDAWELTPTLSPDGKYFFYELNNNIMQVDLASLIYEYELEGVGKAKL